MDGVEVEAEMIYWWEEIQICHEDGTQGSEVREKEHAPVGDLLQGWEWKNMPLWVICYTDENGGTCPCG